MQRMVTQVAANSISYSKGDCFCLECREAEDSSGRGGMIMFVPK